MKVKYLDPFYVSGISTVTNNENELNEEKALIPALWDKYAEDNIESKTFNKTNNFAMYGLCHEYESDANGDYKYTIGVEVSKPKNAIKIERQRYLVFTKEGELPDVVLDAWIEVLEYFQDENCQYERAFNIDFEKYLNEDQIEIYISIK